MTTHSPHVADRVTHERSAASHTHSSSRKQYSLRTPLVRQHPWLRISRSTSFTCSHALPSSETSALSASLPADLTTLTVPQLKEHLRTLKLPVSGRKSVLIERLQSGLSNSSNPQQGGESSNVASFSTSAASGDDVLQTSQPVAEVSQAAATAKTTRKRASTRKKQPTVTDGHLEGGNGASSVEGSLSTTTDSPRATQARQGVSMPSPSTSASTAPPSTSASTSPSSSASTSVSTSAATAVQLGSQMSREEVQGVAAATRIAAAVTIEALLEQMGLGDEDEEDDNHGTGRSVAVDTEAVTPWLRDTAAAIAATETEGSDRLSRTSHSAAVVEEDIAEQREPTRSSAPSSQPDSETGESIRHLFRNGGANEGQASGPRAKRVFGSEVAAAINRCNSVAEVASVVEAASAVSPMFRIHCCAAIQRVARLANKEPKSSVPLIHKLVGELSIQLLDQLHQCDVRSLSTLLWSFGRLEFQPTGEFSSGGRVRQLEGGYMVASIVACLTMMDNFGWKRARPVDLVDILEGVVRLQLNEPDLIQEVLQRLQMQMGRADSYCVSHALWACGQLPSPPPKEFLDAAARRFTRLCESAPVRPFELATAMTGCVNLDLKDYRLFAAMKQTAATMFSSMHAEELSMLCWGLASLDDNDHAFMRRVVQHIRDHSFVCSPRVAVNLTWAAARMELHSLPLAEYTKKILLPALRRVETGVLVQGIWSFAKMRHFTKNLYEEVGRELSGRFKDMDSHGVSSLLWAYAHVGYRCAPLVEAASEHIEQCSLTSWSPQQLALTAWSLSIVEGGSAGLFKQLMVEAVGRGHQALTQAERAQLFQVYMKLQERGGQYVSVVDYTEREGSTLLAACRDAWRDNIKQSKYSSSRSSYEVAGLLTGLGFSVQVEQETEDGLLSIDIAMTLDGGRKVAVEVDGPSHFTSSVTRQLLGPTLSRYKSLQHRGWQTICVPLHELSLLKTGNERQEWLVSLLDKNGVKVKETAQSAT